MFVNLSVGPFILMYHSIGDNTADPYSVSANSFREQLTWLVDNGYEFVSLSWLHQSLMAGRDKHLRKKVVITFDDGYQDFITNALPILSDHGAPATVFLVTALLGKMAIWDKSVENGKLMTVEEVQAIKAHGISLGSHTATHANLARLTNEELVIQLDHSHDFLAHMGETFFSLSYPWGQWSSRVVNAVRGAGYECALAVGQHTRLTAGNSYVLPRVTMRRDTGQKHFQAQMTKTGLEMELRRGYRAVRNGVPGLQGRHHPVTDAGGREQ